MSKNETDRLSSELARKKIELESVENNSHTKQDELFRVQKINASLQNELDAARTEQARLNEQFKNDQRDFNLIQSLLNSYISPPHDGSKIVKPPELLAKIISPEELANLDMIKKACESKDVKIFDLLVDKLPNLNIQDSDGKTFLIYAAENGFHYAIDKLLQKGADTNAIDSKGSNALIYCAHNPHITYVKKLAEKTTNLELKSPAFNDSNALHLVVANTFKNLFSNELHFELNNKTSFFHILVGNSPQGSAIYFIGSGARPTDGYSCEQEKTLHLVKFLTDRGVDINAQNGKGLTVLFLACAGQMKYLVNSLLDQYELDLNLVDIQGFNILHWALAVKDAVLIERLLQKAPELLNLLDNQGSTALFWAAKYKSAEIVKLLFTKYKAADLPNKLGLSAWDVAIINSLDDIIDILISSKGVSLDAVKLWCAARSGNAGVVEEQVKTKKIDPNVTINNLGNSTALIEAVIFHHLPVIKILLNYSADLNKPDATGASPLYYSLGYAGPINPEIVKFLVSKGADINQPMSDGDTPMHMTGYRANIGAMKLFLDLGANVNVTNDAGKTPLHLLIEKLDIEHDQKLIAMKYSLLRGASTKIEDCNGEDAIIKAKTHCPDYVPILEHPETLDPLPEFEKTISGSIEDYII